jgi:hypothetical protein
MFGLAPKMGAGSRWLALAGARICGFATAGLWDNDVVCVCVSFWDRLAAAKLFAAWLKFVLP